MKLPEKVRVPIKTDKIISSEFIDTIRRELNPTETNQMDGIKLIWSDKWIHIRKSNT